MKTMTLESLFSNRIKFKNNLESDITIGKTLLLKQFENVKLSDFLNNLSVCIQKLKRSTEIVLHDEIVGFNSPQKINLTVILYLK